MTKQMPTPAGAKVWDSQHSTVLGTQPSCSLPSTELLEKLSAILDRARNSDRRFLSVPHAAKYTDLSVASIRRLLAAGKLTAMRPVRGKILIDVRELDATILGSTARPRKGRGMR
jgi:excisionase family DNA binding protein